MRGLGCKASCHSSQAAAGSRVAACPPAPPPQHSAARQPGSCAALDGSQLTPAHLSKAPATHASRYGAPIQPRASGSPPSSPAARTAELHRRPAGGARQARPPPLFFLSRRRSATANPPHCACALQDSSGGDLPHAAGCLFCALVPQCCLRCGAVLSAPTRRLHTGGKAPVAVSGARCGVALQRVWDGMRHAADLRLERSPALQRRCTWSWGAICAWSAPWQRWECAS